MQDELKACPFCGAPAELDTDQGFRHYGNGRLLSQVAVYCTGCGVAHSNYRGDLGLDHEQTVAVTVEAWNTRADRALAAAQAKVARLTAENANLRQSVIAFGASYMVAYAKERGFPAGHLHPLHYDILADSGARMDDFTRAALVQP